MGRTNGRLIDFLKCNLETECFINLKYELDENGLKSDVFYLEMPRYDRNNCEEYEAVLKAWYATNGKLDKYKNYSNGKSVILAALKKSDYLISLESRGKQLRFRFATSHEIKEIKRQKKLLKENQKDTLQPLSPSNPPSISSGYGSMVDSEVENMQSDCNDQCFSMDDLNEFLENSVNYNNDVLNEFLESIENDVNKENQPCVNTSGGRVPLQSTPPGGTAPLQNIYPDGVPQQNIQHKDFKPEAMISQCIKPVTELKTIPVGVSGTFTKYWLCTQKINIKGTLQIICEMQVTDENSGIKDGSYVIPGDVFEPGVSYDLKKSFELNNLQYFFFSANCAEKEK